MTSPRLVAPSAAAASGDELTGTVRSTVATLAVGGLVIALVASLGLSYLDDAPPVLAAAALLGLGLMAISLTTAALFLPDRHDIDHPASHPISHPTGQDDE